MNSNKNNLSSSQPDSQSIALHESQQIYQNPSNLTENLSPDNSAFQSTHFSEQRVVESQIAHPTSTMTLPTVIENEMADDQWIAKQQLMKPVQISQVAWTTSQARGTNILSVSLPSVLEGVESIFLRTLSMYAYYKLTPCLRIQINSTQFHQGQLICSFDPFSLCFDTVPTSSGQYFYDYFYATGLPNVKIMASESDAVELCIPFVHPRSYLTTNRTDVYNTLGRFRITVLNPLTVSTGTTPSVTVTTWLYAQDSSVHVPIFYHTPILDYTTTLEVEATSGMISSLSQMVSPVLSQLKTGASQTQDIFGNLVSGNVGQALRKGQGLVDTLGSLLGFDYPARTLQPPKTISPIENMALCKGQSQSQRMATDAFSLHSVPDEVAGESIHSMDLLKIAQMPMLLAQFQFLDTSTVDSQLFTCPINPTVSPYSTTVGLRRTYLSAISNAFGYWSGGINFDIEIVATRYHSGKLLFAFVPNTDVIPSYVDAASGLPNIIIDLQQTSSTRFKVPYVSSTSLKNVARNVPYVPSGTALTERSFYDSCIGTLVCYVQNQLTHASNVAPQIEVNVYISAADDFKLYVPEKPLMANIATLPEVEATSNNIGIDVNKNNDVVTQSNLAKGTGESQIYNRFGEQYTLSDLIKRFSFVQTNDVTSTPTIGFSTFYSVNPLNYTQGSTSCPYLTYFSFLYSAFTGSIRHKYVFNSSRNTPLIGRIYHAYNYSPSHVDFTAVGNRTQPQGLAELATTIQQDNTIECEIPYYSKFNMLIHPGLPVALSNSDQYTNNGFVILTLQPGSEADIPPTIPITQFMAAGEDFRFIYLRPFVTDFTNLSYSVPILP